MLSERRFRLGSRRDELLLLEEPRDLGVTEASEEQGMRLKHVLYHHVGLLLLHLGIEVGRAGKGEPAELEVGVQLGLVHHDCVHLKVAVDLVA